MTIYSKIKASEANRRANFYDQFREFLNDDEYHFLQPEEPDFDFEAGSDEEKIYNARIARFKANSIVLNSNLSIYYTDDESSEWFGYSYEEIIGMANDGVVIPEEVLAWANAMAEANANEATVETEGGASAHELYLELKNNPFLNIKTITKIFVNKCVEKTDELEAFLEEIDPIEQQMKDANLEAEHEKEKALNDIKSLVEEWKKLQEKADRGEDLTDSEKDRLEELKDLFADKDDDYQKTVNKVTRNFTEYKEKLVVVNQKADVAMDFGTETLEVARELGEYERTHRASSLFGSIVGVGIIGVLGAMSIAGNKSFSKTAHTIGLNTQYFATDVNETIHQVQLLMESTADVAGFDLEGSTYLAESITAQAGVSVPEEDETVTPSTEDDEEEPVEGEQPTEEPTTEGSPVAAATTTTTATEGGEPTEGDDPTEGGEPTDDVPPSDEEPEPNPDEDEKLKEDGKKALTEIDAKELSLPKLKKLIIDEGKDSEAKGKESVELVEQLKAQSAAVNQKEDELDENNDKVEDSNENPPADGDNGDIENAENDAENSQNELNDAKEKEALTVSKLRKTFKASAKANKKYSKDVQYSDREMKDAIWTGSFTIAGGSYMTGVGIFNIVTGNAMIAAGWWNPAMVAMGAYLIDQGVIETIIGGTMIDAGTALTIFASDGLEVNEDTAKKIGVSNETLETSNTSLDEIEREQKEANKANGVEGEEEDEEGDEEDEEDVEEDDLSDDRTLLQKMYDGTEALPPKMVTAVKEGITSSKLGTENVKKFVGLAKEAPALIEQTIAFEQEQKAKEAEEAADPESEPAEGGAQDPAEIYAEYRDDYNADLDTNNEFKKDLDMTAEEAKENLEYGALGTAAGAARTALGAEELSLGSFLAAQWWSPFAMMIGLALIKKGTEDTVLGTEMLTVGLALTVISTSTLAADAVATQQVKESDEKTNDSLDRVDQLEAEINQAVKEQLEAQNGKDLSQMSTIELLTLIIMNGINSSVLGEENQEILEQLRGEVPQIIEAAREEILNGATPAEPQGEEVEQEPENEEEPEEGDDNVKEEETVFTQYKTDFATDLTTNEQYSAEIKEAQELSPIIKSPFFNGAPVEKANNKIATSSEITGTALDEVTGMENELKAAIEQAKAEKEARDKEAAANAEENPEDVVAADESSNAAGKKDDEEVSPEDAQDQEGDSEASAEDSEKAVEADDKTMKKQAKEEKKEAKSVKRDKKQAKRTDKQAKTQDKKGKDQEAKGAEQQKTAETSAQSANPDDAEASTAQTTSELSEAQAISGEVEGLVSEVQAAMDETKSAAAAATAENQAIVAEMTTINSTLQQDQTKMTALGNELKQVEKENNKPDAAPAQAPAQAAAPEPEPEPQPQPQPQPAKKPKKPNNKPEEKPENTQPAATPAPVQAAANTAAAPDSEPTVQDAPAGSDKTEFASDKEKQPDFVGFVAQSDSLASGSVLASSAAPKKTTTTSNAPANNKPAQQQNNAKAAQAKKTTTTAGQNNGAEENDNNAAAPQKPQDKGAKRTTPKAFDINKMNGGNAGGAGGAGGGEDKAKGIRANMQSIQAASFNHQARLNAMQIRANNNVQERIAKEAWAQAEAAKKQRLAQEKQERIAKIKEYASYVQMAGGLLTTTGMIVEKCGTVQMNAGTLQVEAGTTQIEAGTAQVSTGTSLATTGTAQTATGTAETATGTAMTATGAAFLATGAAVTATGTAMVTAGTVMIATGTAMLSNPFTAAAGAALVASGTTLETSGASMEASGATLTASGGTETASGGAEIASGGALIATGGSTMAAGFSEIAAGAGQIAAGAGQIAAGVAQIASGISLVTTGTTLQTIGTITTAAGAATSAGADFANGNILGGIASIVGAAASVVGCAAPVSQLGNAAIQLGASGVSLAGQLATNNADQGSSNNQQQKKKKPFQENARTKGIVQKTQKKAQAVGNRFNK